MRVAIVGSRRADIHVLKQILQVLPASTSEIVSGGADGVDALAARAAELRDIPLKTFLPNYETYGKRAPLVRNLEIVEYADEILAFWDGQSHGTRHIVGECIKRQKPVRIYPLQP